MRVGDTRVDLSPPYPRIALSDLIQQRLGVTMDAVMPVADARAVLDRLGVEWEDDWGSGKLMKAVVDEKIQHEVVEPIFVLDYPQEVSPLARVHRSRPGYVERFELMVAGFELCNAYSEQNDAAMQLEAFLDEARAKGEGDVEAGDVDYDYVRALEYGMPCTGGLGVGIDRLVMLLSESSNIREVLLFPTMRPEPGYGGAISAPSTGTRGLGPLHAAPPAGAVEPAADRRQWTRSWPCRPERLTRRTPRRGGSGGRRRLAGPGRPSARSPPSAGWSCCSLRTGSSAPTSGFQTR